MSVLTSSTALGSLPSSRGFSVHGRPLKFTPLELKPQRIWTPTLSLIRGPHPLHVPRTSERERRVGVRDRSLYFEFTSVGVRGGGRWETDDGVSYRPSGLRRDPTSSGFRDGTLVE